eukprot:CAMPEP_0118926246 /NCGR_PEP_ID=MMETSP1169-20130426/3984_1 /TAXON_ID=36882 /ORGANISM="Pyramimonas obovata, Strain CCMP722" /LENGTH=58 /DNA_ID=CAMNT_0006867759 /DNA_START=106 /DNA_END=278 /DNA_ORIENTATION=+
MCACVRAMSPLGPEHVELRAPSDAEGGREPRQGCGSRAAKQPRNLLDDCSGGGPQGRR